MSEWWTYSLHDFLLFAPRTYYRLIELHNVHWWPAQVVALLAGLAVAVLLLRERAQATAPVALVLALAWAWVGTTFLWQRYATINWAAEYMAPAFVVEAILLAASAWRARADAARSAARAWSASVAGWSMLVAALGYGAIAPVSARGIGTAEVFGITADPTVLATLGVLLLAPLPLRPVLLPIPLAWCVVSGATRWAMDAPEALLLPLAALCALGVVVVPGRRAWPRARG